MRRILGHVKEGAAHVHVAFVMLSQQ